MKGWEVPLGSWVLPGDQPTQVITPQDICSLCFGEEYTRAGVGVCRCYENRLSK